MSVIQPMVDRDFLLLDHPFIGGFFYGLRDPIAMAIN